MAGIEHSWVYERGVKGGSKLRNHVSSILIIAMSEGGSGGWMTPDAGVVGSNKRLTS